MLTWQVSVSFSESRVCGNGADLELVNEDSDGVQLVGLLRVHDE